jgi:Na+/H+-dicarboxylate symporter
LLVFFLLGVLIAYASPTRIELFAMVVDTFVSWFMSLAPVIVFVVIFNSVCILISERNVAGATIHESVMCFLFLILGCSLFASTVLSLALSSRSSAGLSLHAFEYITAIIFVSMLRPVTMALILGVVVAFAFSRSALFEKAVNVSNKAYGVQERALKLLLKCFPAISMSLGGTLYYSLGQVSMEVYLVAMCLTLILGVAALATLYVIVQRITHVKPGKLLQYSKRMFAVGLSTGSSYLALPLALRLFKEHFDINQSVGNLVLSLGASMNRCGSVMGVLVVTYVAARYMGVDVSWEQMLMLAVPVALIGFGSPGIQGGTLLVAMPVILHVVAPSNSANFVAVALALFVGGTTFIQAAVNNIASGYIALLIGSKLQGKIPAEA